MIRLALCICLMALPIFASVFSLKSPLYKEEPAQLIEEPCDPLPRAVLESALPCSGCGTYVVSASFIFWQAKLWGLEFAAKSFIPNTPGSFSQTINQKLYVPDFAWKPGFKVNLGYNLPYDGWDLAAGWTFYHEECTSLKKNFESVVSPEGIGIVPLWHYPFVQIAGGNSGNPLRYGNVSGNWEMNFNSFDVELGRYFFPEQSIPMRLNIGVKGAYIKQFYHADYANGTTILATNPVTDISELLQFVSSRFQFKSDHSGLGPRLGLSSKWNFWREFNLIGNGAFSVLCSFFNLHTRYDDEILPTPGPSSMKMDEDFHELSPVCEAMLGLDWGTCFCNKVFLGASLGFEWQYWWSVNHARRNYVQTLPGETFDMRGELQMQGLNAALKCDF